MKASTALRGLLSALLKSITKKMKPNYSALLMLAVFTPAISSAALVTFDTMTSGSVNGQGEWTTVDQWGNTAGPALDQAVVDLGGGNKVWRISNGVARTSYADQPFSQTSPLVAGEVGSNLWNDKGPDHTKPLSPPHFGATAASQYFHASFDFTSATGAGQAGLAIGISPSATQSNVRNGLLSITDDGSSGFLVRSYDTGPTLSPFGAEAGYATIASGLSYSDWHSIDIYIEFRSGLQANTFGNDLMHILLNGSLVHTGSTWESYYASAPFDGLATTDKHAVDSMLFRVGSLAAGTLGNGFHFDNVLVDNAAFPQSAPDGGSSVAMLGLALVGLVALRRKLTK